MNALSSESLIDENIKDKKIEDIKTSHYQINGSRVLDLGKNNLSSLINFGELSIDQKKEIKVLHNLPSIEINNQKYYVMFEWDIMVLFNEAIFYNNKLKAVDLFGDAINYIDKASSLSNKQNNIKKFNTNMCIVCNTLNLKHIYNIPKTTYNINVVLINDSNHSNTISTKILGEFITKEEFSFYIKNNLALSIMDIISKKGSQNTKKYYQKLLKLLDNFNNHDKNVYKIKSIILTLIGSNQSSLTNEQKLFFICLYSCYINKYEDKNNVLSDLLTQHDINVCANKPKMIITQDFLIDKYYPNVSELNKLTALKENTNKKDMKIKFYKEFNN